MRLVASALLVFAIAPLALVQSGCFWVAAGGAGYGGYKVGKDDRDLHTQMEDASITSQVKTKLLADSEISGLDIDVDTYQGVVSLYGHVETARDAKRAVRIAHGVKGVHRVDSKLVVLSK